MCLSLMQQEVACVALGEHLDSSGVYVCVELCLSILGEVESGLNANLALLLQRRLDQSHSTLRLARRHLPGPRLMSW